MRTCCRPLKCYKIDFFLRKSSASIQPITSPPKFDKIWQDLTNWGVKVCRCCQYIKGNPCFSAKCIFRSENATDPAKLLVYSLVLHGDSRAPLMIASPMAKETWIRRKPSAKRMKETMSTSVKKRPAELPKDKFDALTT